MVTRPTELDAAEAERLVGDSRGKTYRIETGDRNIFKQQKLGFNEQTIGFCRQELGFKARNKLISHDLTIKQRD